MGGLDLVNNGELFSSAPDLSGAWAKHCGQVAAHEALLASIPSSALDGIEGGASVTDQALKQVAENKAECLEQGAPSTWENNANDPRIQALHAYAKVSVF